MLTFRTAGHWSPITFLPYIGGITLSGNGKNGAIVVSNWELRRRVWREGINMADRKSRAISHSVVLFRVG